MEASAHCIQDAKLQVRHDNVRVCILQHAYGVSEHNQYGAALLNIHGANFAENTCIVFCSGIAWVFKNATVLLQVQGREALGVVDLIPAARPPGA